MLSLHAADRPQVRDADQRASAPRIGLAIAEVLATQGAAILAASNPAEFMTAHEASLLAGTGGAPLPASMSPEHEAIIKANTELFNSLKVESVPYVLAKNLKTGTVVTNAGAMETAALAEFLGV